MSKLTGTWTLDPAHTEIKFVARHAMVTKVRGEFTEYTDSIVVDAENPENSSARLLSRPLPLPPATQTAMHTLRATTSSQ